MLVKEASFQAESHHIDLMAYLDLDTLPLVAHILAMDASLQVK
jgi:hypothetical protein